MTIAAFCAAVVVSCGVKDDEDEEKALPAIAEKTFAQSLDDAPIPLSPDALTVDPTLDPFDL